MSEFSLIADYFAKQVTQRSDVLLGIGDDAALVNISSPKQLAISVDTLNEGIHFPKETTPYDIGWKSLAVNLSDMAAMGARPMWFTLAISLPQADENWLSEFTRGLFDIAEKHGVQLIGGDTTRGPLSISVQITGEYLAIGHMRRDAAKAGDQIYVTGLLGDGALGLLSLSKNLPLSADEKLTLIQKLNRPEPRVKEALAFCHLVNGAIDISDGLYADLSHILESSGLGAVIIVNQLPVSRLYRWVDAGEQMFDLALAGGDDYELCLTVPPQKEEEFLKIADALNCPVARIGEITIGEGLHVGRADGSPYVLQKQAYDHFI